ncbi:MAG: sortase [Candidatus Saccharimonadales bacterium]
MNLKFNITIGTLFILAGILLGSGSIISYLDPMMSSTVAAVSTSTVSTKKSTDETSAQEPVHISVPNTGLSVNIQPGYYNEKDGSWTLSKTEAQFAVISNEPNTVSGNTYIYGHNTSEVFAKLQDVKTGDKAIVSTADGKQYTYVLVSTKEVSPTDVDQFSYKGKPILTLQTCSGLWDQYRKLFVFNLESVN